MKTELMNLKNIENKILYEQINFTNMKIKILLTVLISAFLIESKAQSTGNYKFSLDEAREFAMTNNRLIKNAKLTVNATTEQKKQAVAQGLPQADISMDYINYFNYELEFSFGGGGGEPPILDYTKFDLGDYEILKLLQGFMEPSEPSKIILDNSASAKFQVNQLVFSGQYFVGIQTAKIALRLSQQALDKTSKDIKELVSFAYFLVLMTEESMSIVENNISNLEQTIDKSEAMLRAGIIEQTDVDQIKMALSMLKNTRNSMNRSLEFNYNSLRFQLGLETNDKLELTDSFDALINQSDLNGLLLSPFSVEENIDYQMIQSQEELGEKMIDLEKAAYLPTLVGFYSYNEKILTTDFDMNPKHLAGLSMSWPIFSSGLRNSKLQKAKIELEKTRVNKNMVVDQLLLQEKQYRYNLNNAIDNYFLQKENMELAKNVYSNMERKYNQGILSSLDLTQANDNYLSAQTNYLSSVFEVLQSKLALNKLLNNI